VLDGSQEREASTRCSLRSKAGGTNSWQPTISSQLFSAPYGPDPKKKRRDSVLRSRHRLGGGGEGRLVLPIEEEKGGKKERKEAGDAGRGEGGREEVGYVIFFFLSNRSGEKGRERERGGRGGWSIASLIFRHSTEEDEKGKKEEKIRAAIEIRALPFSSCSRKKEKREGGIGRKEG